jgi:hypothetical protein
MGTDIHGAIECCPQFGMLMPEDAYRIRVVVAAFLSVRLGLDGAAVDEILREAERVAFERGWHPPLAPRGSAAPLTQ